MDFQGTNRQTSKKDIKLTGFSSLEDGGVVNPAYVPDGNSRTEEVGVMLPPGPVFSQSRFPRRCFSRKVLHKRVPILGHLARYSGEDLAADLVAGITVGLTVIPQAIAYANVAGLPPQYGLYSSFVGCFVYAILGSCKDSPIGPTAIMAILTRENLHELGADGAIILAFLTGMVQLLMGIAQLGFLIDFISGPVSVGFTSAAAIIIASTQIKDLLGLKYEARNFIETWSQLVGQLNHIKPGDAILGFSCMAILLILRKVKDIPVGPRDSKERSTAQKLLGQALWFVSTARNILVVVICALIAYAYREYHQTHENTDRIPFALTGDVKPHLPGISLPPFQVKVGNRTQGFLEMCSNFGSAIIILPMLSILEDISLAKVFSDGRSIDATQEILALGACNVLSSFVGSMPISGALSRGAVNHASGVRTTIGGVYSGIIVILSLQFFTPLFYYIPKASLAAVIIAAVVFMVEFHVLKPIWKTNKIDLIPTAATFISCLFLRLELGILVGIGTNVLFLLYASARPSVQVEKHKSEWGCEYLMITPDRSLVFPSVEYVRNMVTKAGVKQGSSSIPVVIDSRHVQGADFTAAKGVKSLIDDFNKRNQPLLFYNLKPSVVEIFKAVQPVSFVHCSTERELYATLRGYSNKNGVIRP